MSVIGKALNAQLASSAQYFARSLFRHGATVDEVLGACPGFEAEVELARREVEREGIVIGETGQQWEPKP